MLGKVARRAWAEDAARLVTNMARYLRGKYRDRCRNGPRHYCAQRVSGRNEVSDIYGVAAGGAFALQML